MRLPPMYVTGTVLLLVLGGVATHQRYAYLKVKAERNALRLEHDALRIEQEAQITALEVQRSDLREQLALWKGDRAVRVFKGQLSASDYPGLLARVVCMPPLPDPENSPYLDCLGEIELQPVTLEGERVGARIVGVVPLFWERRLTPLVALKEGDLIHAALMPEQVMGESVKRLRRVSKIEDFSLDTYYLSNVQRLGSEAPRRVMVKTKDAYPAREASMAADLQSIQKRLDQQGGDWEVWHQRTRHYRDALAKMLKVGNGKIERDGRITFSSMTYISMEPGDVWPDPQITVLLSMQRQLTERGIDLLLVPIPSRELVNAPFFLDDISKGEVIAPYRLHLHQRLLQAGIEVLDLLPAMRSAWGDHAHVFYDGSQRRPADGAVQVAAQAVAERLGRYRLEPMVREMVYIPTRFRVPEKFKEFPPQAWVSEQYVATRIFTMDLQGVRDIGVRESPVLLLSDSYGGVPRDYGVKNANFVAHLSARLGRPISHKEVGGGGPQMLKHVAGEGPGYLKNRRVCIFLLGEHYLFMHRPNVLEHRWDDVKLPAFKAAVD